MASPFDENEDDGMHNVYLETQSDLGMDEQEFGDLDGIVIDKKYKEMKERGARAGCCKTGFLCRLYSTYDTHFLLSLGL